MTKSFAEIVNAAFVKLSASRTDLILPPDRWGVHLDVVFEAMRMVRAEHHEGSSSDNGELPRPADKSPRTVDLSGAGADHVPKECWYCTVCRVSHRTGQTCPKAIDRRPCFRGANGIEYCVNDPQVFHDWRDVPVTAGMLVEATGPNQRDPLAQQFDVMRDRIEGLARKAVQS